MSEDKYTVEHHAKVFCDTSGDYVKIGEDRDGLDLCEMSYVGSDGEAASTAICIPWEMAEKAAHAILSLAELRRKPA